MSADLHATPRALEDLTAKILVAAGASENEAAVVARYLVMSDLVGHASHGVLRVRQYVEQIQKGEIVCRIEPVVVNDGPGFAVLEGGLGFGQIGAEHATRLACAKAKTQGIALVALRNSAHVGRLGDWVALAAELGCVSFHFVNTLSMPRVAPWGGREGRLSTNPLAWGMPVAGGAPIVVDLTTSVVAEGKVRLNRDAGKPVPKGWIVDREGKSTTDAKALYDGGSLLPLGGLDAGHKGYALSLMVDLMAGAISGGGASGPDRIINCNNFTVIAIDPTLLAADDWIVTEAARFAEWIKSATPAVDGKPVLLPGDVERHTRARHLRDGLLVSAGAIKTLTDAATLAGAPVKLVEDFISTMSPN
ncbi:MAG: Ldh family oxidoreductase [Aeromicrobium sp.]|nr:Ldh family oxidoreductase [Burkholderiales bacterium]